MIVKVLDLEKNKARLVLQGEGHTFMNALTDEILRDPTVDVASYIIEFQFSDPELLVTTKGKKDPIVVIVPDRVGEGAWRSRWCPRCCGRR